MKETEITVQVFEEKEQILSHLQKQGFKLEELFLQKSANVSSKA